MAAIFARLNSGRNSARRMQTAKKRLELVLVMWDDDLITLLTG
jgi:hypothetical protein